MKPRISTDSWIAFIAGLHVPIAVIGIDWCVESLRWAANNSALSFHPSDIFYYAEGFVVGGLRLFVGIRLLISGRGFLTPAIWCLAFCAVLSALRDGSLLTRISPGPYSIATFAVTFITQIAVIFLLIYLRSRATKEA